MHVDSSGQLKFSDIEKKPVSLRTAAAEGLIIFPESVSRRLRERKMETKKGPILHTAVLAGTMAAKKTDSLIPFCHSLPLEGCDIRIDWIEPSVLRVECRVKAHYKTGVEMEALTGVSVTALTIYDMCKSLSHDIQVQTIRLCEKTGGKSGDFRREGFRGENEGA